MLIEALLYPFFLVINFIIGLFPSVPSFSTGSIVYIVEIINKACYFFSPTALGVAFATIMFFKGASMAWAIIEWVYKKLPGVD